MSQEDMYISQILQQSPDHIGYDQAKAAYYQANRNISQAIANIWNLPPLPTKPKAVGVNAEKWKEVREICDEFDREMYLQAQVNKFKENPVIQEATPMTKIEEMNEEHEQEQEQPEPQEQNK